MSLITPEQQADFQRRMLLAGKCVYCGDDAWRRRECWRCKKTQRTSSPSPFGSQPRRSAKR